MAIRKLLVVLSLAASVVPPASAQDAKAVIAAAQKALGTDVKTVQYSAAGLDFALGQNPNPRLPWPKFIDKTYTRAINFETPASRMDRVRMQGENPPHGGGQQPVVGEQKQNQTIVVSANTPWTQQLEIWMMPQGFLRAASTRDATVSSKTVGGKKYTVVTFTGGNKAKVNGYIDDRNLVERVETWIDHPFVGDMLFEAVYSDYKDAGGALFPMHIVQRQGGWPILDLVVSDVKVNVPVDIAAPAGGGGGGNPPVQTEKLSDGVYLMTGGYAVIAVDFKDYIAFIECGQTAERAEAVIAEAKRLIPNKPIKYLINTHSHFDHSSGLRPFVAEGATIVTHEVNKAFLEKTLALPHTINPDRNDTAKKKPVVEAMGEKRVLTDGTHTIELYHMLNFAHHDGMILAYLPKEKVLLEADGYNPVAANATPPSPASPYTLSLLDNIQRLKLDVQRVVPVHYPADNRVVTLAELTRWVGRSGN